MQFTFAVGTLAVLLVAVAWRTSGLTGARRPIPPRPTSGCAGASGWSAPRCSSPRRLGDPVLLRLTQRQTWLHTWDIYHQVLGTKYFSELGYFQLYECTWEVDAVALGPLPAGARRCATSRRLKIIRRRPRSSASVDCAERFTPERLEEFAHGHRRLLRARRPRACGTAVHRQGLQRHAVPRVDLQPGDQARSTSSATS